jgi:hypothetical protein
MKKAFILITCLGLFYGCATKQLQHSKDLNKMYYNYIAVDHPFKVMVLGVKKNNVVCGRTTSYTLLFARPIDTSLPAKISVILPCDNQSYHFKDVLEITPIPNNMKDTHDMLYFTTVKTIKGIKYSHIIGSEYPAVWGKATKN